MKLTIGTSLFAQMFANRFSGVFVRSCDNCLARVNGECTEHRVLTFDMCYTTDGRTYCLYWRTPFKAQSAKEIIRKQGGAL
jgi:hypothetical protein